MALGPLVTVLLGLALIGFLAWALVTYVPMPDAIRKVIIAVVVIVILVWLLRWLGLW